VVDLALMKSDGIGEANEEVLQDVSRHVDSILSLSQLFDSDQEKYALRFQMEHATAKAAYQLNELSECLDDPPPASASLSCKEHTIPKKMSHMCRVLQCMADLARATVQNVLQKSFAGYMRSPSLSTQVESPFSSRERSPLFDRDERGLTSSFGGRSSSGDDTISYSSQHEEALKEVGANLMHHGAELLSLLLVAHDSLRSPLQEYLIDDLNLMAFLKEAVLISKEHELTFFAEGYLATHMKLVANLTYQNPRACDAIAKDHDLLVAILSATKIDEENPGMVEWAEFSIRNLCLLSEEARKQLGGLKAKQLTKHSADLLHAARLDHTLDDKGKLSFSRTARQDSAHQT
jgi:ataxin-10